LSTVDTIVDILVGSHQRVVQMEALNVTASVLQTLRDKIITGELRPGYRLNEIDMSTSLGISRPPLREALRMLENDRLVVNVPRKGTYVSELSLKDFVEVSQAREMIECYSLELLKTSSTRYLPEVEIALDKQLALPLPLITDDPWASLENIKAISGFHVSLVQSTGNSLLCNMYHSISYTLARYQCIYFHIDDAAQHSVDDHKRVLEFLRGGDFDEAKQELRKHIEYTVGLVKNRILHRAVF
jgi:DNA-binding GntR family transcriptional regulator